MSNSLSFKKRISCGIYPSCADENAEILVVAAKTEADIAELETYEDRQMFLQEAGLEESGVNRLIKAAYKLLDLETFKMCIRDRY